MGNYFVAIKEALKNLFSRPYTVLFPSVHVPVPDDYRGSPVLNEENCTLCNRCVRVCPTYTLSIDKTGKKSGIFTIDLGRCCYCQECERICPSDAISLDAGTWMTAGLVRDAIKFSYTVDREKKEDAS